mgnify:CR=1 FL=1
MKTYRVDIEFTSPAFVVADTEEDAIQDALDKLIESERYEAIVSEEVYEDDDYEEDEEWA